MKALRIAIVNDVFWEVICFLWLIHGVQIAIHFTKIVEVDFDDNIF